jgi:glycosyltransferase involved in cell wall biosynthesis
MKLSVLVPTYRRSDALSKCLAGLARQSRPADQVIVVTREDDIESATVLTEFANTLPLTRVIVDRPGVVQALNAGLTYVTGDILTITDDDSVAFTDWLERIEQHFARDPHLGGLGGRDVVHAGGVPIPASKELVGRILPFGKIVGNHHIGMGKAREVDHLKGVNMSWRMEAVGARKFDSDLRGEGAQVYFELGFSLEMKSRGWRLVYDPAVTVDHFPASRFDSDQRNAPSLRATENASFNLYLMLFRYLKPGWRRQTAIFWAWAVGTERSPGILRGFLYLLRNDRKRVELRSLAARAWKEASSVHERSADSKHFK